MRARVTKQGVLIPKELLEGVEEVDIQKRDGLIVVSPLAETDPIFDLGRDPIRLGIEDASTHHDELPEPQGTLADFLQEHIGVLDSSEYIPGGARMSQGQQAGF